MSIKELYMSKISTKNMRTRSEIRWFKRRTDAGGIADIIHIFVLYFRGRVYYLHKLSLSLSLCVLGLRVTSRDSEIRSASHSDVLPRTCCDQEDLPQHRDGQVQAHLVPSGPLRTVTRKKDQRGWEPSSTTITRRLRCPTRVISLPWRSEVKIKVVPKDVRVRLFFVYYAVLQTLSKNTQRQDSKK